MSSTGRVLKQLTNDKLFKIDTNYLKDFTYKINIGPAIFLMSISFTFLIAAITVGYRATVAAVTNPVKSLRSE